MPVLRGPNKGDIMLQIMSPQLRVEVKRVQEDDEAASLSASLIMAMTVGGATS